MQTVLSRLVPASMMTLLHRLLDTTACLHQCLHHAYFRSSPSPTPTADLPRIAKEGASDKSTTAHALLSDSKVKDGRRRAGAVESGAGSNGAAEALLPSDEEEQSKGSGRKQKRQMTDKEREEARRRIARKLAFG